MQSFFEYYTFMLNDLYSAYKFLSYTPSPFVTHIRNLELTLNMRYCQYAPWIPPAEDEDGGDMEHWIGYNTGWVRKICSSLAQIQCLHNLRVSLDIQDHGAWRKIPERNLAAELSKIRVLCDFSVELPPDLPFYAQALKGQMLDSEEEEGEPTRFKVIRRPPLRYWDFHPGEIEKFAWETHTNPNNNFTNCGIAVFRGATLTRSSQPPYNNPYVMNWGI